MRIKSEQIEFIKQKVASLLPEASVFFFGSRVFDHLKGGDIDLLVLGDRQLTGQEKREIKIAFQKKFGEQKIDIVSFTHDQDSVFKDLTLQEAVRI